MKVIYSGHHLQMQASQESQYLQRELPNAPQINLLVRLDKVKNTLEAGNTLVPICNYLSVNNDQDEAADCITCKHLP